MDTIIEEYQHAGLTVKTYLDESADSPRTWDNLGKLLIFGKYGYQEVNELGKQYRPADYSNWDEMAGAIMKDYPGAEILPVYRYEHSGVMYNTTGFSCPWDSCQVGYIVCTKEDILKEYGCKIAHAKVRDKVREVLAAEVGTYSQWAYGDVYGYVVTDANGDRLDGKWDDSCWGFYGTEACKAAANEAAEAIAPVWFTSAASRAAVQEATALEAAGQLRLALA